MKYIVVCYDIEKDRKRNRVFKALKDAGLTHVQKSVFEGRITKSRLERLQAQLAEMIHAPDRVRYYTLCRNCRTQTETQGLNISVSGDESVLFD